jgi:hypothetical protein
MWWPRDDAPAYGDGLSGGDDGGGSSANAGTVDDDDDAAGSGGVWPALQTYESDLAYVMRFMVDKDLRGAGWLEVDVARATAGAPPAATAQWPQHFYNATHDADYWGDGGAALALVVHHSLVRSVSDVEQSLPPVVRVLSFDIECTSTTGEFPDPDRDPIITVCAMTQLMSADGAVVAASRHGVVFQRGSCDAVRDARVVACATERALLEAFDGFVRAYDPDIVTGYNIDDFDLRYVVTRATALGLRLYFGRGTDWNRLSENSFSSGAYGTRRWVTSHNDGRTNFDMLTFVRREYKLSSYALNAVASEFLNRQKDDLPYKMIPLLQRGSAADRARIASYCLTDAELVLLLMQHLMAHLRATSMARVTGVPLSYVMDRGQQAKIFSLVYRAAGRQYMLLPHVTQTQRTAQRDAIAAQVAAAAAAKQQQQQAAAAAADGNALAGAAVLAGPSPAEGGQWVAAEAERARGGVVPGPDPEASDDEDDGPQAEKGAGAGVGDDVAVVRGGELDELFDDAVAGEYFDGAQRDYVGVDPFSVLLRSRWVAKPTKKRARDGAQQQQPAAKRPPTGAQKRAADVASNRKIGDFFAGGAPALEEAPEGAPEGATAKTKAAAGATAAEYKRDPLYEGAIVLEAATGFYRLPVTTLDFASLYPSIMMAHNMCFSTAVPPEDVDAPYRRRRAPTVRRRRRDDDADGRLFRDGGGAQGRAAEHPRGADCGAARVEAQNGVADGDGGRARDTQQRPAGVQGGVQLGVRRHRRHDRQAADVLYRALGDGIRAADDRADARHHCRTLYAPQRLRARRAHRVRRHRLGDDSVRRRRRRHGDAHGPRRRRAGQPAVHQADIAGVRKGLHAVRPARQETVHWRLLDAARPTGSHRRQGHRHGAPRSVHAGQGAADDAGAVHLHARRLRGGGAAGRRRAVRRCARARRHVEAGDHQVGVAPAGRLQGAAAAHSADAAHAAARRQHGAEAR